MLIGIFSMNYFIINSAHPTSVVTNVNDAPTGTVNITGTPEQNQTLTATNTLFGYSLTLRESNIAAVLLKNLVLR